MAAEALEKSMLESKDKEQLFAIAQALGIKTTARAAKATLIDKILETTGTGAPSNEPTAPRAASVKVAAASASNADVEVILGPDGEPLPDWEVELIKAAGDADADAADRTAPAPARQVPRPPQSARAQQAQPQTRQPQTRQPQPNQQRDQSAKDANDDQGDDQGDDDDTDDGQAELGAEFGAEFGDGESRNARRRRRRRNKNRPGEGGPDTDSANDRDQSGERVNEQRPSEVRASDSGEQHEPVAVEGYLDLRDEGYGFLRVAGFLPNRDDAYVPVKLTRQFGLRKGDRITGMSRPAGRNEKNPALLDINTINGDDPDKARLRPKFEDLTALFPDERLHLENTLDPADMTARIIDLVSPIGKGQRGIIVSPPKAGKTTVMKAIATAIEKNHPEVILMVLLIDERPEEVTDMRRTVKGEVISSTFDRPSDEHAIVAEMTLERAKRLVEQGKDVVIILDGITRLSRAYNLAAPPSGRILSGGIDAGALYPPKKFFGAARNVEEGGSLTILATALVETNSRMDEAIFEEFKGTGNMELRLDRRLAERRIYPAIDVDSSSTRHEELLFNPKQLQMVWKLRRVLSGLAAEGSAAPGLELLMDRLKSFRSNDEFLNEIAKQPGM